MARQPPRKPAPKHDPPNPAFSWPLFWKDFRENIKRAFVEAFEHVSALTEARAETKIDYEKLALAIVKAQQLCETPAPVTGITFSFERTLDMNQGDVTVKWVDSPSTNVANQNFTASVQPPTPAGGTAPPPVTVTQQLPPNQASFVLPAVVEGAVASVSIQPVNASGIGPAPTTATYNVPTDLSVPLPVTDITFAIGNVQPVPPPAPPAAPAEAPPAAPAA